MTDEDRWVVNSADEALEFEKGKYAIASWDLDWHADANGSLPSHAHAALVQCVRDAETLRQARDLAREAFAAYEASDREGTAVSAFAVVRFLLSGHVVVTDPTGEPQK